MDLHIAGRVALVCGSSSGLGFAIAQRLAREGCHVVLNGRNEERLNRSVTELKSLSGDPHAVGLAADVSKPDQAAALVGRAADELGPVDILVCNAGGPAAAPFSKTPAESWQAALELNLLSTVHLCRVAVPSMRSRGWGRVVCLTSIAAKQPLGGLILSTTARAGVLGFAKSLADEVATDGVTVNSVCPGYMRTGRVTDLVNERAAHEQRSAEEIEASLVAEIPQRRMGEPDELAAAVAFLASDAAGYITGAALQVDGRHIRSIL
jgi:3-oxoacyl-[acyl-carrier protein] reductase